MWHLRNKGASYAVPRNKGRAQIWPLTSGYAPSVDLPALLALLAHGSTPDLERPDANDLVLHVGRILRNLSINTYTSRSDVPLESRTPGTIANGCARSARSAGRSTLSAFAQVKRQIWIVRPLRKKRAESAHYASGGCSISSTRSSSGNNPATSRGHHTLFDEFFGPEPPRSARLADDHSGWAGD